MVKVCGEIIKIQAGKIGNPDFYRQKRYRKLTEYLVAPEPCTKKDQSKSQTCCADPPERDHRMAKGKRPADGAVYGRPSLCKLHRALPDE